AGPSAFHHLEALEAGEVTRERHGRVEIQIREPVEEGLVLVSLVRPQMWNDENEAWVTHEDALHGGGGADRARVDPVGRRVGLAAGVDDDGAVLVGGLFVDLVEPRVVGGDLLDVAVDLDSTGAFGESAV